MSAFDKDTFLNQSVTGANETEFTPVPEGEYTAYIDDITTTSGSKDGRDWYSLSISWMIPDDKLKAMLGLDKPTVKDNIFLDVENGGLAFGPNKNVRLGRVRDAVNQNDPKKAWSLNMLKGAGPVKIKVSHRFNKETGEGPYAQIDRVAKG